MVQELPVGAVGSEQVVVSKSSRGQVFLLLTLQKTTCPFCARGVRVESTWATTRGEAHQLTWCRSCFNADSDRVDLDEGLRDYWRGLVRQVKAQPPHNYWTGARAAIDDLERRGLV